MSVQPKKNLISPYLTNFQAKNVVQPRPPSKEQIYGNYFGKTLNPATKAVQDIKRATTGAHINKIQNRIPAVAKTLGVKPVPKSYKVNLSEKLGVSDKTEVGKALSQGLPTDIPKVKKGSQSSFDKMYSVMDQRKADLARLGTKGYKEVYNQRILNKMMPDIKTKSGLRQARSEINALTKLYKETRDPNILKQVYAMQSQLKAKNAVGR